MKCGICNYFDYELKDKSHYAQNMIISWKKMDKNSSTTSASRNELKTELGTKPVKSWLLASSVEIWKGLIEQTKSILYDALGTAHIYSLRWLTFGVYANLWVTAS